jgi:hypothetical protein
VRFYVKIIEVLLRRVFCILLNKRKGVDCTCLKELVFNPFTVPLKGGEGSSEGDLNGGKRRRNQPDQHPLTF